MNMQIHLNCQKGNKKVGKGSQIVFAGPPDEKRPTLPMAFHKE